jgi:phosphate transport system substrate-binding protein
MASLGTRIAVVATALSVAATAALAQTTLKIDGSTGAMPLVAALAKAHADKTPDLMVEIGKGLGTKARIEALQAGGIDIAVASHGLKVDELRQQGMTVDEIARAPVVFAVNAGVPVAGLSQAQICAIYSGALANWSAAGGPDLAIAARTRPDSEVDAEVVRDAIACLKALQMPDSVKVMQRGGDMAKELAATAGAIGMTTLTVVEQSGGKVKALSLDGVAPGEADVAAGRYRLVREVFLVARGNASPATKSFLAFVKTPEAADVVRANGAIPSAGR